MTQAIIERLRAKAERAISAHADLCKRVNDPKYPDWADDALALCMELEMHRADYAAIKAAGFQDPGELLDAYLKLSADTKRLDEVIRRAWLLASAPGGWMVCKYDLTPVNTRRFDDPREAIDAAIAAKAIEGASW